MALQIFVDALPYTYIDKYFRDFLGQEQQTAALRPNVGYSSNLHWQMYCNLYPDDMGFFTDWKFAPEHRKDVVALSKMLSFTDSFGNLGMLAKKFMDHYMMRDLCFANIPFRFRPMFTACSRYLFWNAENFDKYDIFKGYQVISQDINKGDFQLSLHMAKDAIKNGTRNLFLSYGFADVLGHRYRRDINYDNALHPFMKQLREVTDLYRESFPDDDVLIVSDHGMATVESSITVDLEKSFGKQSMSTYFAYIDSCIMRVYCPDKKYIEPISGYLQENKAGHLLTESEREYYGITDRNFGGLIFNLFEGSTFDKNWFGYALRKENRVGIAGNGIGMHGFWPADHITDHSAVIMLKSADKVLTDGYASYRDVYKMASKLI